VSPKPEIVHRAATQRFLCAMQRLAENGFIDVVRDVAFSGISRAVYWDETIWDAVGGLSLAPKAPKHLTSWNSPKSQSEVQHRTRLMQAVAAGRIDRVSWLLGRRFCSKEHINLQMKWQHSPVNALIYAIGASSPIEIVQMLLDAGADVAAVCAPDYPINTCIDAIRVDRMDILDAFLRAAQGHPDRKELCINALIYACQNNSVEAAAALLKNGANPNAKITQRNAKVTPLIEAVRHGAKDVVLLLLRSKANVNQTGDRNYTALHEACNCNPELVSILLEFGADVNAKGSMHTPLMIASEKGCADIVRALIARGADVNVNVTQATRCQSTALSLASESGAVEVVKLLLDARAHFGNQKIYHKKSSTPLSVFRLLREKRVHITGIQQSLLDFIREQRRERENFVHLCMFHEMLKMESGPNELDSGEAPLLPTIMQSSWDVSMRLILIHMLLDAGADINAQNTFGTTALMIAFQGKEYRKSIALALLKRGANPSIKRFSGKGETISDPEILALVRSKRVTLESRFFALMARSDYSTHNVPAHFRTYNEDATAIREGGITMLMQALQFERFDAAKALLKHGAVRAQVNLARCDGATALMLACLSEAAADVVRMLIAAGADIMASQDDTYTALTYAAAAGNATIIEILIAAMDAKTRSDPEPFNNALHYAITHGRQLGAVKALIPYCDEDSVLSHLTNWECRSSPGQLIELIKVILEAGIYIDPGCIHLGPDSYAAHNRILDLVCADFSDSDC
jgi:hypothetical protein